MSEIKSNIGQSFETWFTTNFNEDFKRKEANAIRKGLLKLKNDVVANVLSSGFNKTNELSKGVVLSVDKDRKTGKVHILGKKSLGGFLRIFELGTYKADALKGGGGNYHFGARADERQLKGLISKDRRRLKCKTSIAARHFFTKALEANKSSIAPAIIENLREIILNAKRNG